jgi:hypothetical protein
MIKDPFPRPKSLVLCLLGEAGALGEDEADMGRLQSLLEARGFPPHLAGVLGTVPFTNTEKWCSGSVTFWYGSRSSDPYRFD